MKERDLKFGGRTIKPEVRRIGDMEGVIHDKDWLRSSNKDRILYYMYRDCWKEEDKETIDDNNLRFDITVIPPYKLGQEFVKTKGHYHAVCTDDLTYPEVYEIMQGRAHILMQKRGENGIDDAVLVEAKTSEKVVIPPNYGHITINPTQEPLKMSNWISRDAVSLYKPIKEKRGGAYFETSDGFIKNSSYNSLPALRTEEAPDLSEIHLKNDIPLYHLVKRPDNLRFLNYPERYTCVFDKAI